MVMTITRLLARTRHYHFKSSFTIGSHFCIKLTTQSVWGSFRIGAGAALLKRPRVELPAAPDPAGSGCPTLSGRRHRTILCRCIGFSLHRQLVPVQAFTFTS